MYIGVFGCFFLGYLGILWYENVNLGSYFLFISYIFELMFLKVVFDIEIYVYYNVVYYYEKLE